MRLDSAIVVLLGRVRRRLRLYRALEWGAWAWAVGGVTAALVTLVARLGWLSPSGWRWALVGDAALVAAVMVVAAARRISLLTVALQVDGRAGLHERLSSAVAFSSEAAPTRFQVAALADAARVAPSVRLGEVAPWRRPRGWAFALVALLLVGVTALVPLPRPPVAAMAPTERALQVVVDRDQLEPDRQAVAALLAERPARATDDETQRAAVELATLLGQLDEGTLTRTQVFERLSQIQARLPRHAAEDAEQLKQALAATGKALAGEKLTQQVAQALAQEDLDAAQKELEKLAAAAEARAQEAAQERQREEKPLTDEQRQQLARSLDRAAHDRDEQKKSDARQAQRQKLQEEQRRLQRQLQQNPRDEEARRRLQRDQRELERLEREQQQQAQQQRQLERLQRELDRAAESLRQKLSPQAAEALRRAGQQMGDMQDELRKLGRAQKLDVEIGEIKEVVRRAGRSVDGNAGSSGQAANGNGHDPQASSSGQSQGHSQGKGKGKGQNGPSSLLREFQSGAGGNKKEQALLLGGKGQEQQQTLLLPLPTGPGGNKPGPGAQPPSPRTPSGDGIGDDHDPNLFGARTDMQAHHQATQVRGVDGDGPSRSETIAGSAQHGFATRQYQKVYGDYAAVLEEVMQKENVPPGYRYYVKRYFQLIAPR